MWWWLTPLLIVAAIIAYLLFAPFYFIIDSTSNFFGLRFHRLANARLTLAAGTINIDIEMAWWHKRFNLFKKPSKRRPSARQRTKKKKAKFSLSNAIAIVKTFRITKLYLDADTADPALNGILYPLFYALGQYTGKPVSINFTGNNVFILQVENNFARILKSIIYSYLKPKNHAKSE